MPRSLFKLCYLAAIYCGDATFITTSISKNTQDIHIVDMIREGYLTPDLKLTDKAEILLSQVIGLVNGNLLATPVMRPGL